MFELASHEALALSSSGSTGTNAPARNAQSDLERELVSHASGANPRSTKVSAINSFPLSDGCV